MSLTNIWGKEGRVNKYQDQGGGLEQEEGGGR